MAGERKSLVLSNVKTSGTKMAVEAWLACFNRQNCLPQWINIASLGMNTNSNNTWMNRTFRGPYYLMKLQNYFMLCITTFIKKQERNSDPEGKKSILVVSKSFLSSMSTLNLPTQKTSPIPCGEFSTQVTTHSCSGQ